MFQLFYFLDYLLSLLLKGMLWEAFQSYQGKAAEECLGDYKVGVTPIVVSIPKPKTDTILS